jgi:hypothetical protein
MQLRHQLHEAVVRKRSCSPRKQQQCSSLGVGRLRQQRCCQAPFCQQLLQLLAAKQSALLLLLVLVLLLLLVVLLLVLVLDMLVLRVTFSRHLRWLV